MEGHERPPPTETARGHLEEAARALDPGHGGEWDYHVFLNKHRKVRFVRVQLRFEDGGLDEEMGTG